MAKIKTTHGGHYGKNKFDPGAVGCGYQEAIVAQQINKLIIAKTGAKDASDFSATNVNQNLKNQVDNMDRYAGVNDWNISNHLNAASPAATGVEVFYYSSDNEAKAMATKISATISKVLGIPNRGAKRSSDAPGGGLYVVDWSIGHTLLIEWGFVTNSSDMNKLVNKLDKVVTAVVECFDYKLTGGGTTSMYYNQKNKHYTTIEGQTAFYLNANFKNKKIQYVTKGAKLYISQVKEVSKGVFMGKAEMGWISLNKNYVK